MPDPMHNLDPHPPCAVCDAMLTDALEGTLSPAEQRLLELHLQGSPRCAAEYAEAQRGVASLEMLKLPRPQPRPELLARILAETAGMELVPTLTPELVPVLPGAPLGWAAPPVGLLDRLRHLVLQPRLLMCAASAFCSVAITLSLAGVSVHDLRAADLGPAGLRVAVHSLQASLVRRYDSLRVVDSLESRVDDLREDLTTGQNPPATAPRQPATTPQPAPAPAPGKGHSELRRLPASLDPNTLYAFSMPPAGAEVIQ